MRGGRRQTALVLCVAMLSAGCSQAIGPTLKAPPWSMHVEGSWVDTFSTPDLTACEAFRGLSSAAATGQGSSDLSLHTTFYGHDRPLPGQHGIVHFDIPTGASPGTFRLDDPAN